LAVFVYFKVSATTFIPGVFPGYSLLVKVIHARGKE